MNEENLKQMVEQLVRELAGREELHGAPKGEIHHADPSQSTSPNLSHSMSQSGDPTGCHDDITQIDLRKQYLVENPKNAAAFLDLKARTPARIGLGRAGARYKTATMLRFRADHAAAQDSVFSLVEEEYPDTHG